MTIQMNNFGKFLVTREDAKEVLGSLSSKEIPILDFVGVVVANHPFMDELGKGLVSQFSLHDLSAIKVENTNSYVENCLSAGFYTASAA